MKKLIFKASSFIYILNLQLSNLIVSIVCSDFLFLHDNIFQQSFLECHLQLEDIKNGLKKYIFIYSNALKQHVISHIQMLPLE